MEFVEMINTRSLQYYMYNSTQILWLRLGRSTVAFPAVTLYSSTLSNSSQIPVPLLEFYIRIYETRAAAQYTPYSIKLELIVIFSSLAYIAKPRKLKSES